MGLFDFAEAFAKEDKHISGIGTRVHLFLTHLRKFWKSKVCKSGREPKLDTTGFQAYASILCQQRTLDRNIFLTASQVFSTVLVFLADTMHLKAVET